MPSALNPPAGCRFHTRLPYVSSAAASSRRNCLQIAPPCHRLSPHGGAAPADAIVPADGGFSPSLERLVAAFSGHAEVARSAGVDIVEATRRAFEEGDQSMKSCVWRPSRRRYCYRVRPASTPRTRCASALPRTRTSSTHRWHAPMSAVSYSQPSATSFLTSTNSSTSCRSSRCRMRLLPTVRRSRSSCVAA